MNLQDDKHFSDLSESFLDTSEHSVVTEGFDLSYMMSSASRDATPAPVATTSGASSSAGRAPTAINRIAASML